MPNELETLKKQFEDISKGFETFKKDTNLKLDSAQKDAKQYKEVAEKREEENRLLKESNEKTQKETARQLAESRQAEISEFVDGQVKAGKIQPAIRESVIAFMKSLTSEAVIEFTEKNGDITKKSQLSLFKHIFSKAKAVPLGEMTPATFSDETVNEDGEPAEEEPKFMAVLEEGVVRSLPMEGMELDAKAKAYQESQMKLTKVKVSYYDALIAVSPKVLKKVKA